MIIVILNVNGTIRFAETRTEKGARIVVARWRKEAQKHFPNKVFVPKYYLGERVKVRGVP